MPVGLHAATIAALAAIAAGPAGPATAAELADKGPDLELSLGSQSAYTRYGAGLSVPRIGAVVAGLRPMLPFGFPDRVVFDPARGENVRYTAFSPAGTVFVRSVEDVAGQETRLYGGAEVVGGTIYVSTPQKAFVGDSIIAGVRLLGGVAWRASDSTDLFLEGGSGPVLHVLLRPPGAPPYSAAIDGFSGFGLSLGARFH